MAYEVKAFVELTVIGEARFYESMEEAQENIPKFWDEFNRSGKNKQLEKLADDKFNGFFGVCFPKGTGTDYMIAVSSEQKTEEWEVNTIPAGNYLKFEAIGPVPREIQRVTNEAYEVIIPASQHDLRHAPEFEFYPAGNLKAKDYVTEIWIPVE
ncbi:GyrI-like domain-containing protein [Macrococcus lamae]|uniref:AraC family transcriptional regulator n=1 Tax=Macrococcus lamae TaxID=198484 RepID=A0A4R6BS30_9STAP|nr:effector binding domain-containing protein [Macrococcus lamae]TDM05201.1 AraC family transcriptional regulator [Macrococcus lamae]